MDDWQCHDKSVRYLWRVLCESINLACFLGFQDKWTTLKPPPSQFTTRGIQVCNCLCPAEGRYGKAPPLRHRFPKSPPPKKCVLPQIPLCIPLLPSAPSLTGQPARWLCCPSPVASWRQGALGEWRRARSSAARMNHLGERQSEEATTVRSEREGEGEREREREETWGKK